MHYRGVSVDTIGDTFTTSHLPENKTTRPETELSLAVGRNLRRLRARSGLSVERLALLSGVSRGMITRVETGRSVPTVGLLLRLAEALGLELVQLLATEQPPTSKVLRQARATTLQSSNGNFKMRALSARDTPGAEVYEVSIARGHFEEGARRAPGVRAHVMVAAGIVVVTIAGEPATTLATRDAIIFPADAVHGFHNVGDEEAVLYVTLTGTGA